MVKLIINIFAFSFIFFVIKYIIKSNSNIRKRIIFLLLLMLLSITSFFSIDYFLSKQQKLPLFCYKSLLQYQDGGTVEYLGFGYKVIDFHTIVYGQGWGDLYMFEHKYICPIYIDYSDALNILKNEYINNN